MVHPGEPITVKLYGNQRLYQPGTARYVTLSDLQARMRDGMVVIVRDAATGADITDLVLSPRPLSPHPLSQRRTEH
jgi:polyhydroxyalkanoate synthesis regulator protein